MAQVDLETLVAGIVSGQHLASFVTDTVPALAARPDRAALIYQAKQRSADKPLILMGASLEDLLPYVNGSAAEVAQWRQVAAQYWPGPLTLVLPASAKAAPEMNPEQTGSLGVRVPDQPLARYLLSRTGPLATTSANRSGQPPLQTLAEIEAAFPAVLMLSAAAQAQLAQQLALSLPAAGSGQPSTVAYWQPQGWQILRQGAVQLASLN